MVQPYLPVLIVSWVVALAGCSSSSSGGNTPNTPPVADAGSDRNVVTGSTVNLDGSASSDADGDSLTYVWVLQSQPSGSASSLNNSTTASPFFVPLVNGDYVITLVVNDGTVDSAVDTITITASPTANNPPVADAGDDRYIYVPNIDWFIVTSQSTTFNGNGSSDPDGDLLSYQWTLSSRPGGSISTLLDPTTETPSLTPDVIGEYTISLVVNDGTVDSAQDTLVTWAGEFAAGQTKYFAACGSCHAAFPVDPDSNPNAGDIGNEGELLRSDISSYSPSKTGVANLTNQEIADLNAFLENL